MESSLNVLGLLLGAAAMAAYAGAVMHRRDLHWPAYRTVCWVAGNAAAVAAVAGPLAAAADGSFTAHVVAHLLLGMLAPLLLVAAAPVTLALRALPQPAGRRLTAAMRSLPLRVLTEPGVAAVLDVGGLWLLYRGGLYPALQQQWFHVLVHAHMFLAGYLFTASLVARDPMPHRRGFLHRSTVLVLALAAHDVLAKSIYIAPPPGVPVDEGQAGSVLMYYGGDAVDVVLIVLLCAQWYRRGPARHRSRTGAPLERGARRSMP